MSGGRSVGTSFWRQRRDPSFQALVGVAQCWVLCCVPKALGALRACPVGTKEEPNTAPRGLHRNPICPLRSAPSIRIHRGAFKTERDKSHYREHYLL